ncbi:autotransporter-associated N-terminal domain-containing protein [Fusobacterium sp.]|uniref:autotransporter-associated N-terminal domain-containing protein n=1 Tax=Fusobacterium sp. TaxID=68766 RepID=UPI002902091A|nr:autotransporter-associated N-terminal domain-containing protein [Fusobacterium sp.]MDU1909916.1 autotransporter-associated N-terminal domain-containing protein [Fusobacterium sp.]
MKRKTRIEDNLKHCLKRKITYSTSLLVSFLISGSLLFADEIKIDTLKKDIESYQSELIDNLAIQKEVVEKILLKNEKQLKELRTNALSLVEHGEWYSKSWNPSHFGSIIVWYDFGDSSSKKWVGSSRKNTFMDDRRDQFTGSMGDYKSSGWLNWTDSYNKNTNIYDYEDKFVTLPSIRTPEITKPVAPNFSIAMPTAPTKVNAPFASVNSVGAIAVNISKPTVVIPNIPNLSIVGSPNLLSVSVTDPGVSVVPPNISLNIAQPTFNVTPNVLSFSMAPQNILNIPSITVTPPTVATVIPDPNVTPFSNFGYGWINEDTDTIAYSTIGTVNGAPLVQNYIVNGGTLWSGVTQGGVISDVSGGDGLSLEHPTTSAIVTIPNLINSTRRLSTLNFLYRRYTNTIGIVNNTTMHVAGSNTGIGGWSGTGPFTGTSAIHLVGAANVSSSTFNLYGMSSAVNMEGWNSPFLTINNSTINILGDNNAVFNIQKGHFINERSWNLANFWDDGPYYAGAITGDVDINVKTKNNSIYVIAGYSRGFKIKNDGVITLDGASNIVVSDLGYVTNSSKYIGSGLLGAPPQHSASINDYVPSIVINDYVEQFGDENITLFFNTSEGDAWGGRIGIYQGEISLKTKIGEFLDSNGSTSSQTVSGQLTKNGYTSSTVDANVAVYTLSGQREGIIPTVAMGDANSFNDLDPIHNLEIGEFDIKFGKYSKNGIMFLSKLGTVIDVGHSSSFVDIGSPTTSFSDGINGPTTTEADASMGTIIAYSDGIWDPLVHDYWPGNLLSGQSIYSLPSEIIVHIPLTMSSNEGVAFLANNGGKVTMNGDTHAYNYGSIIAFANGKIGKVWDPSNFVYSTVDVNGNITAVDNSSSTVSKTYKNIGAFANESGRVNINGIATINGIGGFATGKDSHIKMVNTGNIINSGIYSGVVATDYGKVDFAGTINHGISGAPGNYTDTVAFYADENSKINFDNTVAINMYKGLLISGNKNDYSDNTSTPGEIVAARYNNMQNVSVNIKADGVNIGIFDGGTLSYGNESSYLSSLGSYAKLNSLTKDSGVINYESYLINGSLNVTAPTISLDTATFNDAFKNIVMQNQLVTFSNGTTVTSTTGNGLVMGSNSTATSNNTSGYINNGTISISGGTNPIGTYTSFGTITNNGQITVKDGVAMTGVNGSSLINTNNINITSSTGTSTGMGIVGLSRRTTSLGTPDTPENYGVDTGLMTSATKSIDISNSGNISATGANVIGIYAENNTDVIKTNTVVSNTGKITLGDNSTGIMVTNTKGNDTSKGVMLTLSGSGSSDIKVGNESIGIYSKNSEVIFNSDYGIEIKEGSVGVYTIGNYVSLPSPATKDSYIYMAPSDKLTLTYSGSTSGNATGIYYDNDLGQTIITPINVHLNVATANHTGIIAGIVAKDNIPGGTGSIINSGNITTDTGGVYGIVAGDVDVFNSGSIDVGVLGGKGGTGIFSTRAGVSTDGSLIAVNGNNAIGIYAVNEDNTTPVLPSLISDRVISVTGTGTMNINDKNSVGVYVKDNGSGFLTLNNSTNLILNSSIINATDRVIGLVLENSQGNSNNNQNTGNIKVNNYNVGIYLNDSNIINNSTFDLTNSLSGIGIFATNAISNRKIELQGSTFNITTSGTLNSDIPIGVYVSGNNYNINGGTGTIYNVGPNGIGNFLNGDSSSKTVGDFTYSLSSDTNNVAIGAYYLNGTFGDSGTVTLNSTGTLGDSPIGLFYGANSTQNKSDIIVNGSNELIGIYGKELNFSNLGDINLNTKSIGSYFIGSDITNSGNITLGNGISNGYGLYLSGRKTTGGSLNTGQIDVNGTSSIGIVATSDGTNGAIIKNTDVINIMAGSTNSIGVYTELNSIFTNDGIINGLSSSSIGIFANGNTVAENTGTITTNNLGIYGSGDGINGATVNNSGDIYVNTAGKVGIFVEKNGTTANLTGGTINALSTVGNTIGVHAEDTGVINLSGSNINLLGNNSVGLSLAQNSKLKLTNGNISIGNSGTGIYSKDSTIDMIGYSGTITLGNEGIGLYLDNSTLNATANQNLNISYNGADKGIGIYYNNNSSPVTNNVVINHNGSNLVNILSDGIALTNVANQVVKNGGVGIYADNNSFINNQGNISLLGNNSVGIFLDNNSVLTNFGTITGTSPLSGTSKVGVYVENGDIMGSTTYNFDISGGIGIYLANNTISYTGLINVSGASPNSSDRTIGMYIADSVPASNLSTNIKLTGSDGIGLYLASDTSGLSGADITYNGQLDILSMSNANRGIGVYLDTNTTFTLGTLGKVDISGNNNIGFYVSNGATLNVSNGTVNNTVDGIFAYLDNGNLVFSSSGSTLNIDYANVIVNGTSATTINNTAIKVGNGGLQGAGGATITNNSSGTILGTTINAKGLVGTGLGTTITNSGSISLLGNGSVAMYTEDGAFGVSNGNVVVGDKSVAYYSGKNSISKGKLEINGTTTIGQNSSLLYANGGDIDYKAGDITVGNLMTALNLEDSNSIVNFHNNKIIADSGSVGIYVSGTGNYDTGIINLDKIIVNNDAVGIYLDSTTINFNDNQSIVLQGDNAIGIFANKQGNLNYIGNLIGTGKNVKGIVSKSTGATVKNSGFINLTGNSGIGIFSENATSAENNGTITLAKGTSTESTVGIYSKNSINTSNTGTINIASNSAGIYGENTVITNSGNINNSVGYSSGIYGQSSAVVNNGNITLGEMSNGIFIENGNINNNGNITVGDGKKIPKPGTNPLEYSIASSVGIYGGGTTDVYHNNGAAITTGKYGIGLAVENGNIEARSGSIFNLGEESIYMYTNNGTGVNYTNLALSAYSIGMYTNNGTLVNESVIDVGKSSVVTGNIKISIGMATGTKTIDPLTGIVTTIGGGTIINNGTINVSENNSVGMIANNPTGVAINNGTIIVSGNSAYGMEGSEKSTLVNKGMITVTGNRARGIAATTGAVIINDTIGVIEVKGNSSEGIYIDRKAELYNYGNIIVDGTGNLGIYVGEDGIISNEGTITLLNGGSDTLKGGGTLVNVGTITIDSNGPTVTMDGVTINNGGTITVNGPLDFGTVAIGSASDGYIGTINAESFENGELIVLPTLTQGNNDTVKVVQYLNGAINVPNDGSLSIISQSVTWLADLQVDPDNPNTYRIVMVKIPYTSLFKGTEALELGKGLDEIYEGAKGKELAMFDAIDSISNKDELGSVMDNQIRGNIYANIQERILEINDTFDNAYDKLRHDKLYTKESLKIGSIISGGKVNYSNPSISDYKHKTLGVMAVKEYDMMKTGRKHNWSFGFAQTKFDLDNDSKETAYSINLGLGYEDYLGDGTDFKWLSRAEISINHHDVDRKIHLSNGTYTNNGKYWSGKGMWTNQLRYEILSESNKIKAGIFGSMKLGYGMSQDFKETGDGLHLSIKSQDMYFVRPGIGGDLAFTKYTDKGKFVFTAKASYEYELGKEYDGANQAKIKNTSSGYYSLEKPKDMKGTMKIGGELKYVHRYGHSVGVEVIRKEGNTDSTRVGVNFLYRFN